MRQIRNNVFETNSSSVHAISISNQPYDIPERRIEIAFGEYGWSAPNLETIEDRLSYLYTYIFMFSMDVGIKYSKLLFEWLNEDDINYYIEDYPLYYPEVGWLCPKRGYVDHQSLDISTLEKLFTSKKVLYNFLFSDDSSVCIDNDNSDMDKVVDFVKSRKNSFYCGGDDNFFFMDGDYED